MDIYLDKCETVKPNSQKLKQEGKEKKERERTNMYNFNLTHQIWRQAQPSELSDTVLGRLGFLFTCGVGLRAHKQIHLLLWVETKWVVEKNHNAVAGVFQLSHFVPYLWYQANMDVAEVLPLHFELELSEGLDEGHALNVSHCASQLLTQNRIHEHTRWFHSILHNPCIPLERTKCHQLYCTYNTVRTGLVY